MTATRNGNGSMTEMSTEKARKGFSDMLNRVLYTGERFLLTRKGRRIAMVVPADSLEDAQDTDEPNAA